MEYLKYGDLSHYAITGIHEAEIKEIARGIGQGLEIMHRYGFTHRDIKPQNILVVQKRPEFPFWWVKISDFGLSKQVLSSSKSALHTLVGTRDYCAPEILGHLESHEMSQYSDKVDMWSFGCVLFNLASRGQIPFSAPNLVRYCDRIIGFNPQKLSLNVQPHGLSLIKSLLDPQPHLRPNVNDLLQHHWLTSTKTSDFSLPLDELPMMNSHSTRTSNLSPSLDELPTMSSQQNFGRNFNSFLDSTLSTRESPRRNVTGSSTATTITVHTKRTLGDSNGTHDDVTTIPSDLDAKPSSSSFPSSLNKEHEVTQNSASNIAPDQPAIPSGTLATDQPTIPPQILPPQQPAVPPQTLNVTVIEGPETSTGPIVTQERHETYEKGNEPYTELVVLSDRREANQAYDTYTESPLHLAAAQGNLRILKILVTKGADIRQGAGDHSSTPLHYAAANGQIATAEWLVYCGVPIDIKDSSGSTPIHHAVAGGKLEVVKWLVERGASIHAQQHDCHVPLHYAARCGRLEVVKWLLQLHAPVDVKDGYGRQPLHHAAVKGHLEVVKCLVDHGAPTKTKDKAKRQPLHYAAVQGQLEVVKWLVERGVPIDVKDKDNRQPLHHAAWNGHLELIMWATASGHGGDLHQKTKDGSTLLHIAASRGHLKIVKWLISNGANISAKDNIGGGKTARDVAIEPAKDWLEEQEVLIMESRSFSPTALFKKKSIPVARN